MTELYNSTKRFFEDLIDRVDRGEIVICGVDMNEYPKGGRLKVDFYIPDEEK